jgi:hypothetical protein
MQDSPGLPQPRKAVRIAPSIYLEGGCEPPKPIVAAGLWCLAGPGMVLVAPACPNMDKNSRKSSPRPRELQRDFDNDNDNGPPIANQGMLPARRLCHSLQRFVKLSTCI